MSYRQAVHIQRRYYVQRWLGETVLYGGIPVRRACVERHLDHLGVHGPARLVYDRLEAVDAEPVERWDEEMEEWISREEG